MLRPSCDLPTPKPGGAQEGKVLPGYSKSWHHAIGPLTPLQELRPWRDSHCQSYDQAWRDLGINTSTSLSLCPALISTSYVLLGHHSSF